jgi:hypothetical protein
MLKRAQLYLSVEHLSQDEQEDQCHGFSMYTDVDVYHHLGDIVHVQKNPLQV